MVINWDQVADAMKHGSNWSERARFFLEKGDYLKATKGVLEMLEDARILLDNNSKKWMPK
jgi:hypothetical protein